jgi:hypothetical protein
MKASIFKKSSLVALAMLCATLTSCGSQTKQLGTWTQLSGPAVYANKMPTYCNPLQAGIMMTSSDSVTLFSDNTFVWSSSFAMDYSTDKVVWTTNLSYQTLTIYGTDELVNDATNETYTLTIKTVTRVVGNGTDYKNVDTDVVDETLDTAHGKDFNDGIITKFTWALTQNPYTLDYSSNLKGDILLINLLKAPKTTE